MASQQQPLPTTSTTTTNISTTNTNTNKSAYAQANALSNKMPKANAELFGLTYGALVAELLRDVEDDALIQNELEHMGHSMGLRCMEELLAKQQQQQMQQSSLADGSNNITTSSTMSGSSGIAARPTFVESVDIIRIAFKVFFGLWPDVNFSPTTVAATKDGNNNNNNNTSSSSSFSLLFSEHPIHLFVELPMDRQELCYEQLLCGWVRGMEELLQFDVKCRMAQSILWQHETNELVVELQQVLQQGAGDDYQEE